MPPVAVINSPDTKRTVRVPPGQRQTADWPVLHCGNAPRINPDEWRLRLFGLVERERCLSLSEFLALPQGTVFSDVHCVTGWSRLDNLWEGLPASAIKELVKILPEAQVCNHSCLGRLHHQPLSGRLLPGGCHPGNQARWQGDIS